MPRVTRPRGVAAKLDFRNLSLLGRIRVTLNDCLAGRLDRVKMRKALTDVEGALKKYPSVAISSLQRHEVETVLILTGVNKDHELINVEPIQPSQTLQDHLKTVYAAATLSDSPEASARWTIDALIVHAQAIAVGRTTTATPVSLQAERTFVHGPVKYRRKPVMLFGRIDYGIWYGKNEDIVFNVFIVEAKNKGGTDAGFCQALGYMGCVHQERKCASKKDCSAYGLVSDGELFHFIKISHDSKWSSRRVLCDPRQPYDHLALPLGLLVHFICRVATISPAHSKESSGQTHFQESSGDTRNTPGTLDEDHAMKDASAV